MLALDSIVLGVALVVAYSLRFEFMIDDIYIGQIKSILPILIPLQLTVFFIFRLYKNMWRYFRVEDCWSLGYASSLSIFLALAVIPHLVKGIPQSIFFIDMVLTFIMACGLRILIRSFYAAQNMSKGLSAFSLPKFVPRLDARKRVLIIGAGASGEKLVCEILDNSQLKYEVVGFLDDDPGKIGRSLHRFPILGPVEYLPRALEKFEIHQIFISVPSATGDQMRRIVDICRSSGVRYKTLPAIGQIIDGKVSINALRDINYEDLLRRSPVQLDMSSIRGYISGKTVMVTGAGGSIGSELCRQLVRFHPGQIILLDSCEANLFKIEMELRDQFNSSNHHCVLCAVQQRVLMERVFDRYRPHVIFHAAAYKHVPMLERNPWEAVFNNVEGGKVTMELASRYGAERFVLVSTDKAVRPTNVMGTTKRLNELILQAQPQNGTRFMAVRFGNVIGSSGSVLPVFQDQILRRGPVTVTHPEITRYFMTIPEASQLILQAGGIGEGGEIYVLDMGTPLKVLDIAKDIIRLCGLEPEIDIPIVFTGLRPGEKLHEELITDAEDVVRTNHQNIMMLRTNERAIWNGNGNRENFCRWLNLELEELRKIACTYDAGGIKGKLKELIPEYSPQLTDCIL